MKIYSDLLTCTKFKWIKDLNIKSVILNLIEEKVESTLQHIGTGDHFLNITPVAQTLRETVNKWDVLKQKPSVKQRTQSTDKMAAYRMEKDLRQPHIIQRSDLQSIQRTQEIGHISNFIGACNPIKKWNTDLNRELSTEESKMAERHLRKCSISLVIREM